MGEVRLNDGKYGQMTCRTQENRKIRPSVGCGDKSVPSTVVRRYDFRKLGGHLGNVGLVRMLVQLMLRTDGWHRYLSDFDFRFGSKAAVGGARSITYQAVLSGCRPLHQAARLGPGGSNSMRARATP